MFGKDLRHLDQDAEHSFSLAVKWENRVLCIKWSKKKKEKKKTSVILTNWSGKNGRFCHLGWEDSVKYRQATIQQKGFTVTLLLLSICVRLIWILVLLLQSRNIKWTSYGLLSMHTPCFTHTLLQSSIHMQTPRIGLPVCWRPTNTSTITPPMAIQRLQIAYMSATNPRFNPWSFLLWIAEPLSH